MTKKFIERVKHEGIVDTRKYRYLYSYDLHGESIKRCPIEWLDTVKALGEWEIVCYNEL